MCRHTGNQISIWILVEGELTLILYPGLAYLLHGVKSWWQSMQNLNTQSTLLSVNANDCSNKKELQVYLWTCSCRRHSCLAQKLVNSYSHVRGSDLCILYSVKVSYLSEQSYCMQILCSSLDTRLYGHREWLKKKYSLPTWYLCG